MIAGLVKKQEKARFEALVENRDLGARRDCSKASLRALEGPFSLFVGVHTCKMVKEREQNLQSTRAIYVWLT